MKKYIVLLAAAIAALTYSSCTEPKAQAVDPSIFPTATVEGTFLINNDITDPYAPKWSIPANVDIRGIVSYSQYGYYYNSAYFVTGTYNPDNGAYSVTFPVTYDGTDVEVSWGNFIDTITMYMSEPVERKALWREGTITVRNLMPGELRKGPETDIRLDGSDNYNYTIIDEAGDNVY